MKKLLAILILSLFLITPSQADDARDFEIEGISLGDSALKYFSQENLETNISNPPSLKNSLYDQSCFNNYADTYDRICKTYKKNSKKKIINSIQAQIKYNRAAIPTCRKKQKEIDKELQALFKNSKREVFNYKHAGDKTGKTKERDIIYLLNSKDEAGTACIDYGKKYAKKIGAENHLQVFVDAYEYADFLKNEAWQ